MTKAGFGFIAAGGFVYLLAIQTQIGWLYLFDGIIWSLLVLSAILPWHSLRSLQVERQLLLPTSTLNRWQLSGPLEDETVEVKLKVSSNGRFARYFIKVLEDCPFAEPEKRHRAFLLTRLAPGSMRVFSYTATCYRRGYYDSSSVTLQSSGPLGLIVRQRTFQLSLNLTIYPAYYRIESSPIADAAWVDWGHAVKSSVAAEFYGSREYRHGDPLKYIHWRNTAKLGHFMLKEFEQASQGSVAVAFEARQDFGEGKETTLEYSIKVAASLAKLCADSGYGIDIIAGKTPLRNGGWREAMDFLAHLEIDGKVSLAESMAILEPNKIVVAIVPSIETRLIPVLSQLAARVLGLVIVLLEDFTTEEASGEFFSKLKGNNIYILSCPRGNLEAAIQKLGSSLFLPQITSVG
ncbi:MAG: DUF58 domain-containing protein [Chloroflexota bacterium]